MATLSGGQAGFGGTAETRETGKGPAPRQRLAREQSGQPSNPSIGRSDELTFESKALSATFAFRFEVGGWMPA
jgi:hypothetical protein